jgi:hypothetical protein
MEKIEVYVEHLEEQVLLPYKPECIQVDALWSFVGHKGEKKGKREEATKGTFWRITAIDRENRLRLGRALAKTEAEAAYIVMDQIKSICPKSRQL